MPQRLLVLLLINKFIKQSGSYTSVFEIFVIGDAGGFLVDDTIIYHVYSDSHYTISTFDSDKIDSQYTKSIIQFITDGGAGVNDGIRFQIRYFGSQYNKNVRFLFYSRVIKGKLSTSFDHTVFNVLDVQDNHKILYFENLNLNGNLIDGLGDPKNINSATNKKYVDTQNARQDIAIADKASKMYVDGKITNVSVDTTSLLPRDGSRSMTSDLDMDENYILYVKNSNDYKVDDAYEVRVRDLGSAVNKEYLNEKFLKVDKDGNYFDLKQNTIKNCEPYYDGLFDNNSLVSKAYVDSEISKLPKSDTDVLKLDGSKAMTGALDMGGFGIKNIKHFVEDDSSQAASDAQRNDVINFGYFHTERGELKRLINEVSSDALNRNDPDPMEDNIDMANHSIVRLKEPQSSLIRWSVTIMQ